MGVKPEAKKKEADEAASFYTLSGRRDSNPRPRPWQGRALPTELLPQNQGQK
jgi:hypothetical protein